MNLQPTLLGPGAMYPRPCLPNGLKASDSRLFARHDLSISGKWCVDLRSNRSRQPAALKVAIGLLAGPTPPFAGSAA